MGANMENDRESKSALDKVLEQEFEEAVLKFSSFLSIIHDKRLTNMAVFAYIMRDVYARKAFKLLTQIDNDRIIVLYFLRYYPNFCKSKVVKRLVEQNIN